MHPLITETVAADIAAERRSIAARARRFSVRRPRRLARRVGAPLDLPAVAVRTGDLR
jgi:hypothetical protein